MAEPETCKLAVAAMTPSLFVAALIEKTMMMVAHEELPLKQGSQRLPNQGNQSC